jgi:hypothetical protein
VLLKVGGGEWDFASTFLGIETWGEELELGLGLGLGLEVRG